MCNFSENCIFCDFPVAVDLSTLQGTVVCPNYIIQLETLHLQRNRLRNIKLLKDSLTILTEKTENNITDINQKTIEIEALQVSLACRKERLEMLKKENVGEQVCLYALAVSVIKSETENQSVKENK
jgi:hypothetical protein